MQLIGVEPILIVQIASNTITWHFSQQEMESDETLNFVNLTTGSGEAIVENLRGALVVAAVSSIGAYHVSGSERGFGSVGTIDATFMDYSGFFKQVLETTNIYDLDVNVMLYMRNNVPGVAPQQDECKLIMQGKFQTPIEWDEGSRLLTLSIVSNVIFKEFGFVPEFEAIDHIRENLEGSNWPHIFGDITGFGMKPLCNVPEAEVSYDYYFQRYMDERELANGTPIPGGYPDYTNTSESKFVRPSQDLIILHCDNFGAMPQQDVESNLYIEVEVDGGSVLCNGRFNGPAYSIIDWNIPWYVNICVWGPPQHNSAIQYQTDSTGYIPNTMQMLGYGHFVIPAPSEPGGDPNWTFNAYDELLDLPGVDVPFPIEDAASGWAQNYNTPWVKGMYIRYSAVKIIQNFEGNPTVEFITLWARVVHQEVFTLYLDDIRDENGQEFSQSGFRPIFIWWVAKNKVFQDYSTRLYDAPPIFTQKSQEHKEFFLDRGLVDPEFEGVKDLAFKLPKGARVQAVDWWGSRMYPITLDTDTWVSEVYARIGKSLVGLDEASQFALMKFVKQYDGEAVTGGIWYWWRSDLGTWIISTTGPTPLPNELKLWATYHNEDSDFDYWPDEFMFIMLYGGSFNQMLLEYSSADTVRLLITCGNEYNTDEKMFQYLLEKYTTKYTVTLNPTAQQNPVGLGVVHTAEAGTGVTNFLAKIAEEQAKAIRIDGSDVSLVDLLNTTPIVAFIFTEKHVDQRSLIISYTETQDIRNLIKSIGTWTYGTYTIKNKESIARHSEIKAMYSYEINRILSIFDPDISPGVDPGDPENAGWTNPVEYVTYYPRGYNRTLAYWLWRQSNTWMQVSFNTYLDVVHLVPGDIVTLDFTQTLEHNNASTVGVLRDPIQGTGHLPNGNGIVLETSLNPDTWTVSISVLMKVKLGEE